MSDIENAEGAGDVIHPERLSSSVATESSQIEGEPFRLLFENSLDAIVIADDDGRFLEVNAPALALFGYSQEQMSGMRVSDLVTIERPMAAERYALYLETGREAGEFHFIRPDNQVRIASYSACRLSPGRHLSILRDITERRRQQEAAAAEVARQAHLFDTILSSIVDFAYVFDRKGCFTYANQALLDLLGREFKDIVGKNFFDLDYPIELAARLQEQIQRVFDTGQALTDETEYTSAAGTTGYYEYIFAPVFGAEGAVEAVAGSTRDITARNRERAEKEDLVNALAVEHARLADLFQQAPAFIAVVRGPRHVFERVNPPYVRLVGERDLLGKSVREAFPEIEGQGFFEILDEVYRTGRPFVGKEMRILFQDEHGASLREHFLDFVYQPLIEADGSVSGIFAHGVDLTERKRAEEALRESEERFRGLADNIAQLAWIADATGWIFWYNRRWFDYTGTTLEEMQGWGWKKVHHPEHVDRVVEKFARYVKTGEAWEDTFPLRGKDGRYRWFLSRAVPVRNEAGKVTRWFGTNTDVTEQRKAEETLRKRQAEIETLNHRLRRAMTETHHRVKNNLQLIAGLIDMQEQKGQETVPMSEIVRLGQSIRALGFIHDILTQEARADGDESLISVKSALDQFLPLLQTTLGERRLLIHLEELSLPVKRAISLTLIVNELISNAVKHGQGDVEVTLSKQGERAALEVCDGGPGFGPGFDPQAAAHTGLELLDNMARFDLRATVTYEDRSQGGARVVLSFPLQAPLP